MNKILSLPVIFLVLFITSLYYKLFLYQQIPFPGDLLIGSYYPWLDYHKMPVKNPLISDVFSQFILWKYLAIENIRHLQWPLWNPYSFTGNPLLATFHSASLYPLNILLFLPKYFGWGLFIYSQTLIASLTFYLFVSQFTKSTIARLSGAIIFSLGGLMTTWLELGTAVHAMAWIPLALYAVQKSVEKVNFRFILILTFSLAMIVLSGNAQVVIYSYTIVFLYHIWIAPKNRSFYSKSLLLFVGILFSILITAPQLLPSYELLQKSIRQTESYSAEGNFGLLNPKDAFKFFIADYFGNPVTRNYWGNLNYSETSGFMGTFILPLLLYSFFKSRDKQSVFFLILLTISLMLAFDNPISHYLYQTKIPLLTSSYASRILFITILCSAVLASTAIEQISKKEGYIFFYKTLIWSWAIISGIIIGTLISYFSVRDTLSWSNNLIVATRNSLLPFGIITFTLLITFLNRKDNLRIFSKEFFLPLVIVLVFSLDLGRYFLKFNPFISNNLIFPKTPALEFLQEQPGFFRVGREHAEVLPPNTWIAYNLYSYEGYDPIYLNGYGEFMHFLNGGDIRNGSSSRYAEISSNYYSPYLNTANAKYLISLQCDGNDKTTNDVIHCDAKKNGLKTVFSDKSTVILENPNASDRVYFAKKIIYKSSIQLKEIMMTDRGFDPRQETGLSENLEINSVTGEGSAKIVYYSSNMIKIETDTKSDEVLILADQFEDGWRANIDKIETKISPANLIFRAIKIPKGKHEISFYYWPKSFEHGLKISTAAMLLIFAYSTYSIKKRSF